jgi:carotenoid 1,2-hydratase
VPADGYRWWYVDALSDDGSHGLTIIAFVGSVFSPYYKWSRRRGPVDPMNHAAVNVALYGARGHRWAMTERGRRAVARDRSCFGVGRSRLVWDGSGLSIDIDEVTFPVPGRIRGRILVHPQNLNSETFVLDPGSAGVGVHLWRPIAPAARVEVVLERPGLRWQGEAYLDSNWGSVPLERSFVRWDWSRARVADGTAVLYEGRRRDGSDFALALHFDRTGRAAPFDPPPVQALPKTRIWRIPRFTRSTPGKPAGIEATLEDTPFYARSVVRQALLSETATAVHESLELDRFTLPIVQAMLPFRMPRRRG